MRYVIGHFVLASAPLFQFLGVLFNIDQADAMVNSRGNLSGTVYILH